VHRADWAIRWRVIAPGAGACCAAKAALVAYPESLRLELRGSGVRVVTFEPCEKLRPAKPERPAYHR
jgi:NAD(P)-dependent dehydrogenase (short-subunit alcohol dehydrogenase family)